jgi:membrane protein DedA with SNARE-associated domain
MFDPTQFIMSAPPVTVAAVIIFTAFISEDAATITAATLAASNTVEPKLAFASSVLGIWLGDLGLYALAYRYGAGVLEKRWGRKLARPEAVKRGREWFARQGGIALFLSRCLPGTRLPVSLAAGVFKMRVGRFAAIGAAGAIAWVTFNFAVLRYSQERLQSLVRITPGRGLFAGCCLFVVMLLAQRTWRRVQTTLRRWARWEFWPAWLFYIPVVGMWIWLGLKHRGFSLPAIANPGQHNGGLVGESKFQILKELTAVAPEFVAEGYLLEGNSGPGRVETLSALLAGAKIQFPFVLKPNVGQRGAGFKVVHCFEEAEEYLFKVPGDIIVQRFVEGPKEVGIFYVRLPNDNRGEILAITEKHFPVVVGDGVRTLAELINADLRASMISNVYLRRFETSASRVIPAGERVKLVEAGNHCQGCIFGDGMHLYSEALRERIDQISQSLPEFYVGRYDIRYRDDELLRAGLGFEIIELNGAASEATSIYDESNTLIRAYKLLFRQWSLVFKAGARNRLRGFKAAGLLQLWRDWKEYSRQSAAYPIAD